MGRFFARATVVLIYGFLCLGFRAMPGLNTWAISKEDPTLWLLPCRSLTFDENDLPASDPASAIDRDDFAGLVQSVLDDYNNVPTSFARLAFFPDDPDNPPAPEAGQSPFTRTAAERRTITLCFSRQEFTGGHATVRVDGDGAHSCKIDINEKLSKSVKSFITTLTHELGHCLGLHHPQETTQAVMSYYSNAIRLQADDKMGLTFLYPRERNYGREEATFGFACAPY